MAKTIGTPKLSLGNQLYLYRLLRDALGCGKQTLMPAVEDALAAGDMAAADLGFETTRELLEALDSCVQLTIFKGGRIYATVIAQPAWDEALAAGEPKQKPAGKGAKSWKKKKGDKTLKAVKPKHIKRPKPEPEKKPEAKPEPEPQTAAAPKPESAASSESDATTTDPEPTGIDEAGSEPIPTTDAKVDVETVTEVDIQLENEEIFSVEEESETPAMPANQDESPEEVADEPDEPQPAISLTVVYDPENANAGIQTLESNPDAINDAKPKAKPAHEAETELGQNANPKPEMTPEPKLQAPKASAPVDPADTEKPATEGHMPVHEAEGGPGAEAAPKPEPAPKPKPKRDPKPKPANKPKAKPEPSATPEPAPNHTPTTPKTPEGYPVDFTTEVFCPGPLLSTLSQLLPYGADVLGIVGEYYWIARENGAIDAQRNRATFPLRYVRDGERHVVSIRIRRNTEGGMGAAWAIDDVKPQAK